MTATTDTSLTAGTLVFLYLAQDGNFNLSTTTVDFGSLSSGTTKAGTWQINRILNRVGSSSVVDLECELNPFFRNVSSSNGYHRLVITRYVKTPQFLSNLLVLMPSFFFLFSFPLVSWLETR